MEEIFQQVMREARGVWRYRWTAALVAWVVALLGWGTAIVLPDQYEAEAKVYLDTDSLAREALGGIAIRDDARGQVELARQMILSRTQLQSVARDTDLDLRAADPKAFEALIIGLRKSIKVESASLGPGRGSEQQLYRIAYRDHDRKTAENVVQSLLNSLVESSLVQGSNESARTIEFLEDQVSEYADRLDAVDKRLADFKRENVGLLPGEGGDYFERLQREMQELGDARNELSIVRGRRDALSAQLARARAPGAWDEEGTAASPKSDLERQISEQETRLNELLLLFTEKHPDVIATRETLTALRDRLNRAMEQDSGLIPTGTEVYDQVQIALNEAEVEVTSLESIVGQRQARVTELRRLVDTIPDVEARYSRLVRDYDVTKAQYDSLLERLGRAEIDEDLPGIQFEVIEAPLAGLKPVAPNRPRLLFAALVLALATGVGLAWLRNQTHPVFESRDEVYEDLGRPVLGSVSMTLSPRQLALQRTERLSVVVAGLMLFGGFGVVLFLHENWVRLAERVVW
jgi:polysaccharide chain length determinant protein (PEP-CTERM system associated)